MVNGRMHHLRSWSTRLLYTGSCGNHAWATAVQKRYGYHREKKRWAISKKIEWKKRKLPKIATKKDKNVMAWKIVQIPMRNFWIELKARRFCKGIPATYMTNSRVLSQPELNRFEPIAMSSRRVISWLPLQAERREEFNWNRALCRFAQWHRADIFGSTFSLLMECNFKFCFILDKHRCWRPQLLKFNFWDITFFFKYQKNE